MHREAAGMTTTGVAARETGVAARDTGAVSRDTGAATRRAVPRTWVRPGRGTDVVDLRGGARSPAGLRFPAGDLVVVSGLPGGGKSTLMHRIVPALDAGGGAVHRIDSQDVRERWERGRLRRLPYAVYRPLVRAAHYLALRRALRSGTSVVVHDCGTLSWVRRWLALSARRGGRGLHLVLLDVPAAVARSGQAARGRGVSGYAFARHRRAVGRLVGAVEAGRPPRGFGSVVLLDRGAAGALETVDFG